MSKLNEKGVARAHGGGESEVAKHLHRLIIEVKILSSHLKKVNQS